MAEESMSYLEALTEIKRLKEALEQQPCEDCISREAVNDGFKKYENGSFAYGCVWGYINELPSVTPKEKTGHWIQCMPKGAEEWSYRCSKCNFWRYKKTINLSKFNFCPNCGARMVEPQESEDKDGNS